MGNPISAWLLPRLNVVGVDREGGKDAKAVRHVLKSLKAGRAVVIFPEGTRSHDGTLQSAKAGIGLLACRSGVPVLPVRVFGAFNAFSRHHKLPSQRGRIKVVYGRPLQLSDFDPGKKATDRYQIAIDRIMEAIARQEIPVDSKCKAYQPICSSIIEISSSSLTRCCFVVSRSRRVTVSSSSESKSTVIPNGVPISSIRR